MADRQKRKQSNAITTASNKIICTETTIQLSNEKLNLVLIRVYEQARKDADSFKFFKHYGVFLSIAFTLLLSLLTSDFKSFLNIPSAVVKGVVWTIFGTCLVIGSVCCLWNASQKHVNETKERDMAVNESLQKILSEE